MMAHDDRDKKYELFAACKPFLHKGDPNVCKNLNSRVYIPMVIILMAGIFIAHV
jgi:hypothetical protein